MVFFWVFRLPEKSLMSLLSLRLASSVVRKRPRVSSQIRSPQTGRSAHVSPVSRLSSTLKQGSDWLNTDGANDEYPKKKRKASGKARAPAPENDHQASVETDIDESDDTCRPLKNKGASTKRSGSQDPVMGHDGDMDGSHDTRVRGVQPESTWFSEDVWWSFSLSARTRIQSGFVLDDKAAPGTAMNPYQMRSRTNKEIVALGNHRQGETPGLDRNGFPLASLFSTYFDASFWRLQPNLAAIDWRDGKVRRIQRGTVARAAQGQLVGITVPTKHRCSSCIQGNGPFESCRVVYLEDQTFAWSGACCCCAFVGSQDSCSNRLDLSDPTTRYSQKLSPWIADLFLDMSPGMCGLDESPKEFPGDKRSPFGSPSPVTFSRRKSTATESIDVETPKRRSPAEPKTMFEKAIAKLKSEHDAEVREKKKQTRTSAEQHLEAFGVLGSTKWYRRARAGPDTMETGIVLLSTLLVFLICRRYARSRKSSICVRPTGHFWALTSGLKVISRIFSKFFSIEVLSTLTGAPMKTPKSVIKTEGLYTRFY